MKITYEFDDDTDSEKIQIYQNSLQMYSALIDIFDIARRELRSDTEHSEDIEDILSEIQKVAAMVYEIN